MTRTEIYDWLIAHGVVEPAVLQLADRCIIGQWQSVGTVEGRMIRGGPRVAIQVIVEADSWHDAFRAVRDGAALEPEKADSGAHETRGEAFAPPVT